MKPWIRALPTFVKSSSFLTDFWWTAFKPWESWSKVHQKWCTNDQLWKHIILFITIFLRHLLNNIFFQEVQKSQIVTHGSIFGNYKHWIIHFREIFSLIHIGIIHFCDNFEWLCYSALIRHYNAIIQNLLKTGHMFIKSSSKLMIN